ncbi:glycosyltransferase family 2 protein [uncultured Mitsuokella sp.]|uniref:glycosyltransferase family 2 protein n=1 Tax=uncultured Mitsuokella sp. TaxID=453120 RepID=UPI00266F817D|nr:glycosyltransferase family 2 protein [uncultured Mitsuokella sp.]
MQSSTKISVIMPIYNAEVYLGKAIDSVLEQSFVDFELLLLDDGSHDDSLRICKEYAAKDGRIKVYHQDNHGLCYTRNRGIRLATGEYIAFIDNDDLFDKDLLKDNYKIAKDNDADIVKFGYIFATDDKVNRHEYFLKKTGDVQIITSAQRDKEFFSMFANNRLIFVWDALFKRDFIIRNSFFFDEEYKHGHEDIDLCERMWLSYHIFVYNANEYYIHRDYTESTSNKFYPDNISLTFKLIETEHNVFNQLNCGSQYWDYCLQKRILYLIKYISLSRGGLPLENIRDVLRQIRSKYDISSRYKMQACSVREFEKKTILFLYQKRFIKIISLIIWLKNHM